MTNKDKFLKDEISPRDLFLEFKRYGIRHNCYLETDNFEDFMNEQVKPTLTEDERVILRNTIIDNYKYIHRDESGSLWLTEDVWLKPKKDPVLNVPYRESDNIIWFGMYRHLFQFIKERRRI